MASASAKAFQANLKSESSLEVGVEKHFSNRNSKSKIFQKENFEVNCKEHFTSILSFHL